MCSLLQHLCLVEPQWWMSVLAGLLLHGDILLVSISFHCVILLANKKYCVVSAVRSRSTSWHSGILISRDNKLFVITRDTSHVLTNPELYVCVCVCVCVCVRCVDVLHMCVQFNCIYICLCGFGKGLGMHDVNDNPHTYRNTSACVCMFYKNVRPPDCCHSLCVGLLLCTLLSVWLWHCRSTLPLQRAS